MAPFQFASKHRLTGFVLFILLILLAIISVEADSSTRPLRVYGTSDLLGSGAAVASFSPDGSQVLVGGSGAVTLWDTQTGAQIQHYLSGYDVRTIDFSPDGTVILAGYGSTAAIFDKETGLQIRALLGHGGTNWVEAVQFSPDGTRIMTASRVNGTRIWDAFTGDVISVISNIGTNRAKFSPDGTKILLAQGSVAVLRDVNTGGIIHTFSSHTNTVTAIAFSPDGTQILTGSNDRQAKLWNAITGNIIRTPNVRLFMK